MFFIGYFFFQLPSNLVVEKVGVRRWISALMVAWGVISCLMMFVRGPLSFYSMRFLLGAAEAGFFPAMILYMKRWFPANSRARAVAWFMTANPLAGVFGSPISGSLLGLHGAGLVGWQWMSKAFPPSCLVQLSSSLCMTSLRKRTGCRAMRERGCWKNWKQNAELSRMLIARISGKS